MAVAAAWEGDSLAMDVGAKSARFAAARSGVSLLWPPAEPGGYSLIVDGTAAPAGRREGRIAVMPTRAVLHRPAAASGDARPGCAADCVPILG